MARKIRDDEFFGSNLNKWGNKVPSVIRTICPHCRANSNFSVTQNFYQNQFGFFSAPLCPGCGKNVRMAGFTPDEDIGNSNFVTDIFIYPEHSKVSALPEKTDNIPDPLYRALLATVSSFEAENYAATTVSARRTLEGIFKYLVEEKERNKSLNNIIDHVVKNTDLSQPLQDLSHTVRQGGNLGAHFDMEREPTEDIARRIVDLVIYLINYLYILPSQIRDMESQLENDR